MRRKPAQRVPRHLAKFVTISLCTNLLSVRQTSETLKPKPQSLKCPIRSRNPVLKTPNHESQASETPLEDPV